MMDVLQLRAAIAEPQLQLLVEEFYRRARRDDLLGPIFDQRVSEEQWPFHIERIVAFWSTALRGTGRYRANPIEAHRDIAGLSAEHFERWLELFTLTTHEIFEPEIARAIDLRAERMAGHMLRQLA